MLVNQDLVDSIVLFLITINISTQWWYSMEYINLLGYYH